jgi:hypothetical protein
LLLFCNCQFNSIPLLPSPYPGRLASRNSSRLYCYFMLLLPASELFFITTLHGPRRKHSIYCWEGVFTAPLHSNGSCSIVVCVFVAAGIFLRIRCLVMDVFSNFTIRISGVMSQYNEKLVYKKEFVKFYCQNGETEKAVMCLACGWEGGKMKCAQNFGIWDVLESGSDCKREA